MSERAVAGRGGGRKEGPGRLALCARATASSGGPSWRCPRLSRGMGWGGGREGPPPPCAISRDKDRSLKPGVDRFSDPASPGPASLRTGGSGGAQDCGDREVAPACRERPGAGVPGADSTAVLFLHHTPFPPPSRAPRPPARRGTPPARGLDRGLRESARIPGQPAEVPWLARVGATRSPKHVGGCTSAFPKVSLSHGAVRLRKTATGRSIADWARGVCALSAHSAGDVGVKKPGGLWELGRPGVRLRRFRLLAL